MAADDTRRAILDAAEELFATEGFAATTLRELTAKAAVNLAAVNYHFGGKEDLARALLAARLQPIQEERLRRLELLERRATPPAVREIAAAFLEPALRHEGSRSMCRMFGRMLAEQPPFLDGFLREQFAALGQRFVAALARALPHVAEEELWWRLHFTVGAMAHTLQHAERFALLTDGRCAAGTADAMLDRLLAYATAGLAAPQHALPATAGRAATHPEEGR